MNICVYGAASQEIDSVFIETVEKLGEKIAKQRNGEIGKVYLKFNKPKSEFVGQVRW